MRYVKFLVESKIEKRKSMLLPDDGDKEVKQRETLRERIKLEDSKANPEPEKTKEGKKVKTYLKRKTGPNSKSIRKKVPVVLTSKKSKKVKIVKTKSSRGKSVKVKPQKINCEKIR